MKELTIEQKANRYDEVVNEIKRLRDILLKEGVINENGIICDNFNRIFPELNETDDEKIRKIISDILLIDSDEIREILDANNVLMQDINAWLEKQGDKEEYKVVKPKFKVGDTIINIYYRWDGKDRIREITDGKYIFDSGSYISIKEQDSWELANKVESKFKVGDFIVYNDDGCICQIKSIRENDYCIWPLDSDVEGWLKITDIDNKCHLWTIQDAKDGDVLISSRNQPFIYNGWFNDITVGGHCGFNIIGAFTISDNQYIWTENKDIKPAIKKQYKLLFDEMNLLGWVWNPETKELNRLDK